SAGRYPTAGHAGPLAMLPGGWGPAQTGVADFVPTPDDDITLWLHAIPILLGEVPVRLRLTPIGDPRPGDAVVVAAITRFHGTASPLVPGPRREIRIEGALGPPTIDLGVIIRTRPLPRPKVPAGASAAPLGWGRPRGSEDPSSDPSNAAAGGGVTIVDLVATPDARLRLGDQELALADLDRDEALVRGGTEIRALPSPTVRVDVRVTADGASSPARVRFVASDGRYLPPLGHRDEINTGLLEDSGADILLGSDAYAYVPGDFQVDLPIGAVDLEVVKGFEHRPALLRCEVLPDTREIAVDLERVIDLRAAGWRTADPHVHYISPPTALLQAAAEDVGTVHLLATQAGDLTTNGQDLTWGSQRDPTGRYEVVMGTENRQNLLGHLALLGARRSVLPMASGGAPEGRLGGAVDELLGDWADRCHAEGGLVVGAHFPLPYAEVAAAIVGGQIDAVELQTFAPGLDHPPILEWYRFLNCGYRLPVLGGTDKMSAEVPVGAIRTYARLQPDEPATFDAWAAAVRAGRTFASSGPVIELAVDGHEPGAIIGLRSSGGSLEVRATARAAQATIASLEIVMNGRVVAVERSSGPVAELRLAATLDVRSGAWIAARTRSEHEIRSAFATSMAAHTSPVYVEVVDRPLFDPDDAAAIAEVIEGTARWLETTAAVVDERRRDRMVERIRARSAELRGRIERPT
ncbi:MAG: CehA/McbA family metallohydrolase, partial [Candidatus Limnocylindrales bacterium]